MVTKKKAVKKLQPYEIGELDHYLSGRGIIMRFIRSLVHMK